MISKYKMIVEITISINLEGKWHFKFNDYNTTYPLPYAPHRWTASKVIEDMLSKNDNLRITTDIDSVKLYILRQECRCKYPVIQYLDCKYKLEIPIDKLVVLYPDCLTGSMLEVLSMAFLTAFQKLHEKDSYWNKPRYRGAYEVLNTQGEKELARIKGL